MRTALTNCHDSIEAEEREQDARISPSVLVRHVHGLEVLVADLVLAVPTVARRIRVVEVATERGHEVACPLIARLTGRRSEDRELFLLAHHRQAMEFSRHHGGDRAREGVELVEPDPDNM